MKRSSNYAFRTFLFLIFFCGIGLWFGISQENLDRKAAELRANYNWGSIYLTYKSANEFINTLKSPSRNQIISEHGLHTIQMLESFLKTHIGDKINNGIAFAEIDLNIMKAGFLRANQSSGGIQQLSWNPAEVTQIADLCDKLMKGFYRAQIVFDELNSPYAINAISLDKAVNKVQEVLKDPYVSQQQSTIVLYGLRTFIERKPEELGNLKQTNPYLYNSLSNFKTAFDNSLNDKAKRDFLTNKRFSDESLAAVSEQSNLQTSVNLVDLNKASVYLMRPIQSPKRLNEASSQLTHQLTVPSYSDLLAIWRDQERAKFLSSSHGRTESVRPEVLELFKTSVELGEISSTKNLKITGKFGEKISVGNYNITVVNTDVIKQDRKGTESTEGKKLVSVEVVIESENDYGVNIDPQYIRLKDSNFYEYSQTTNGKETSLKTNTNLPKGEKVRGWITFEVFENAKGLIFIYQTSTYDTKKVYIKLDQ